jgi:hypothetical protein
MVRLACALAVLCAGALSLASAAFADSGAVQAPTPAFGGEATISLSAEWSSCREFGYGVRSCLWFPFVTLQAAHTDCVADPLNDPATEGFWRGPNQQGSVTYAHDVALDVVSSAYDATVCLFVVAMSTQSTAVAVARADYVAPVAPPVPPPPTPAAPAPGSPTGLPTFSAAQAHSLVETVLGKRAARTPRKLRMTCSRASLRSFTCRPRWSDAKYSYSGTITIDAAGDYRFTGTRVATSCRARSCRTTLRWRSAKAPGALASGTR